MAFTPKGVIPALITPLTQDEQVNEQALRKLLRYVVDGGVHAIHQQGYRYSNRRSRSKNHHGRDNKGHGLHTRCV